MALPDEVVMANGGGEEAEAQPMMEGEEGGAGDPSTAHTLYVNNIFEKLKQDGARGRQSGSGAPRSPATAADAPRRLGRRPLRPPPHALRAARGDARHLWAVWTHPGCGDAAHVPPAGAGVGCV